MNGNQATAGFGALLGFVVGGIVARQFLEASQVVIAGISIGTSLGAGYAAAARRIPIVRGGSIGGGIGGVVGLVIVALDKVIG